MSTPTCSTSEASQATAGLEGSAAADLSRQQRGESRASSSETPSPGEESVCSVATDGDDGDDASGYWLLCAVICSGKGLYVGEGQLGDLFCMLHTSDGVCRSRTVSLSVILAESVHVHVGGIFVSSVF